MATRAHSMPVPKSDFVAKLLAPLTASSLPVLDTPFRRQLANSAGAAWRGRMRHFIAAHHEFNRASMANAIAYDEGTPPEQAFATADVMLARARLIEAADRQMRLTAPNREALRWKRKWATLDGDRLDWAAAIAADVTFFEEE